MSQSFWLATCQVSRVNHPDTWHVLPWHVSRVRYWPSLDCITSDHGVDVTRDEEEIKSLVTHQKNATCGIGIGLKYRVHRGKVLMEYYQFSFDKLEWIISAELSVLPFAQSHIFKILSMLITVEDRKREESRLLRSSCVRKKNERCVRCREINLMRIVFDG